MVIYMMTTEYWLTFITSVCCLWFLASRGRWSPGFSALCQPGTDANEEFGHGFYWGFSVNETERVWSKTARIAWVVENHLDNPPLAVTLYCQAITDCSSYINRASVSKECLFFCLFFSDVIPLTTQTLGSFANTHEQLLFDFKRTKVRKG